MPARVDFLHHRAGGSPLPVLRIHTRDVNDRTGEAMTRDQRRTWTIWAWFTVVMWALSLFSDAPDADTHAAIYFIGFLICLARLDGAS